MSFAKLKQNRKTALSNLQQQVQQSLSNQGGSAAKDPRMWKLTIDKNTGLGNAIIRFLPWGDGNRLPWATWSQYNFKTAAGNYWNRIRTDLGEGNKDPMKEINSLAWERNQDGDKQGCKKRTIKHRFMANIVVLRDDAHPENNGKNFLYEYGPSIQDFIVDKMAPQYADQQKVMVHDWWEGANFSVRTCKNDDYISYKNSSFFPVSLLHADDAVMDKVYNGMIPLEEFEQDDNYKSYEELEKEVIEHLGARYVAGLRGQPFTPDQAAQSGGNVFQQTGQPTPNINPFAKEGNGQPAQGGFQQPQQGGFQQPQQGGFQQPVEDPFVNQTQILLPAEDVFKNQTQSEPVADPVANQTQSEPVADAVAQTGQNTEVFNNEPTTTAETDDDPFANMAF